MRTSPIFANCYWNDTGIILSAGQRYRVCVVPNLGEPLMDASNHARTISGEKWESAPYKAAELLRGKRKGDAPWFALIGTIDQRLPWVISDDSEFTASENGRLVCYLNDVRFEHFYKNNAGWVVLDVIPLAMSSDAK